MTKRLRLLCLLALPLVAHGAPRTNDFPTQDRVLYVHECVVAHPGTSSFEMISKCSCAIDAIAQELKYTDYVELSTATKATSISGERGGYIRDSERLQGEIKRYRALQAKANEGCFIGPADGR